jgi:hypothetical protein
LAINPNVVVGEENGGERILDNRHVASVAVAMLHPDRRIALALARSISSVR